MITKEPIIYRNVITEEERLQLKDHALDLLQQGVLNVNRATAGCYRNFKSFFAVDDLSPFHKEIYNRIVKIIELKNPVIDPALGIIISVITPGGHIHKHTDKYKDSRYPQYSHCLNMRFNIMIERDDHDSYNPHIDDKQYFVNRTDAWYFPASEIPHHTPILLGDNKRIVYQFGFMIDPKDAN